MTLRPAPIALSTFSRLRRGRLAFAFIPGGE